MNPAKKAADIIKHLRIKYPEEIIVELIAELRGATVVEEFMSSAEGRLVCTGNRGKITVPLSERNEGRKRFSIAHELGHFELHADQEPILLCSKSDMSDWRGYKKKETEANEFASALLMPEELFTPRIILKKPTIKLIRNLASVFNTSLTATAVRYIQLTKEPCALIYSVDKKIKWYFKTERDFPYWMKKCGENVAEESFAYDAFDGKGGNEKGNLVEPLAWLNSSSYSNVNLYESTIYLEYYNATLTLLWED